MKEKKFRKLFSSKLFILFVGVILGAVTVFGSTFIANKISNVDNSLAFSKKFENEIDIIDNHLQDIETEDFIFAGLWLNEDNQEKLRAMSSLSKEEFNEYIENSINPIYSNLFSREFRKVNVNWAAIRKQAESRIRPQIVAIQKRINSEINRDYKSFVSMVENFDKQIQDEIKKFLDDNKENIEFIKGPKKSV